MAPYKGVTCADKRLDQPATRSCAQSPRFGRESHAVKGTFLRAGVVGSNSTQPQAPYTQLCAGQVPGSRASSGAQRLSEADQQALPWAVCVRNGSYVLSSRRAATVARQPGGGTGGISSKGARQGGGCLHRSCTHDTGVVASRVGSSLRDDGRGGGRGAGQQLLASRGVLGAGNLRGGKGVVAAGGGRREGGRGEGGREGGRSAGLLDLLASS